MQLECLCPGPRGHGGWGVHRGLHWQNQAGSEVWEPVGIMCVLPVAGRILGLSSLPFHLIHTVPQEGFSLARTLGVLW